MSWARGLVLLACTLGACDGCHSRPQSPDLGAAGAAREPEANAPTEPTSPAGRAAAHARAVPEARDRASRRATLLADGRRHGEAGRHADALRSLEDALREVEGPDAALHCEAGFQAIQLGQWPLARRHLLAGLEVAVQPRRRAACLYNLALVEEAVDERAAAITALRQSLALRPNGAVERKLRALEAEATSSESEPPATVEEEPDAHPTLQALCAPPCQVTSVELPPLPEPWPELAFVTRPGADWPAILTTWLAANDGDGWRDVAPVAETDDRDVYGALEASEEIAGARFEDGTLVLSIAGAFDEPPGEADHYFECERRHPADEEARMGCFEAATAGVPPPESWAYALVFELSEGRPTLVERRAESETQAGE